jgi:gas vesicle protein
MNIESGTVLFGILASLVSGAGTAMISAHRDSKKEKARRSEKEHDMLKMELKDLEIKLYKLEKDLVEWRDKYYEALQELIEVKGELENCLVELSHIVHHED